MLQVYGVMALCLIALLVVPVLELRLHHYILGLIFVPGTSLQTRPSLLYQGICVGLFVNGIARWDYDSILETPGSLLEDAQVGTILPQLTTPLILSNQSILFDFANRLHPAVDGIGVIVNDVLRFRSFRPSKKVGKESSYGDHSIGNTTEIATFNWTRRVIDEPEYFRFGFVNVNAMGGIGYEDFTDPAVWEANGEWRWSNGTRSGNANATQADVLR